MDNERNNKEVFSFQGKKCASPGLSESWRQPAAQKGQNFGEGSKKGEMFSTAISFKSLTGTMSRDFLITCFSRLQITGALSLR